MLRDTTDSVRADPQFGVADLARLAAVADGPAPPAPEPVGHRLFAAMDRAVHRRPGWTANIAMASDRIAHYENGNGENPRGWHTGAGMLYWWGARTGGDQYTDAFWPTVDPCRLPGTTVSAKRPADNEGGGWGEPKPDARWVGGVTDGEFAAVGQHLKGSPPPWKLASPGSAPPIRSSAWAPASPHATAPPSKRSSTTATSASTAPPAHRRR
ncbi:polysaccharide lyase family 8 super-sandwich domain-containing protein [Streptomyces stramineus]